MRREPEFDEVMIVNPCNPANDGEGARVMQLHYAGWPGFGYYADPYAGYGDPYGAYGYGDAYGYADPYGYADAYGYADPYGYYADPYGGYAQDDAYGYDDDDQVGYYADDDAYGSYADEPMDGYGYGYGYGYGADDDAGMGYYGQGDSDFSDDEGMGGYGYSGFVREGRSPFNAGCPMPDGVAGPEDDAYGAYVPPANVNANCAGFGPQPGDAAGVPETFRPIW